MKINSLELYCRYMYNNQCRHLKRRNNRREKINYSAEIFKKKVWNANILVYEYVKIRNLFDWNLLERKLTVNRFRLASCSSSGKVNTELTNTNRCVYMTLPYSCGYAPKNLQKMNAHATNRNRTHLYRNLFIFKGFFF